MSSSCLRQLPALQGLLGNTGFGTSTMLRRFSSFPRARGSVVWFRRKLRFGHLLILLMSKVHRYTGKDFNRSMWDICGTSQKNAQLGETFSHSFCCPHLNYAFDCELKQNIFYYSAGFFSAWYQCEFLRA